MLGEHDHGSGATFRANHGIFVDVDQGLFLGHNLQKYSLCGTRRAKMTNVFYMSKLPFVTAITTSLLAIATGVVAQTVPPNLPAAIICYAQVDQSWRVAYLGRVNKNGDMIYITPDGRLSATVNAKGVVAPPTNRPAGLDCYGKTLEELRSSGRIMEFQRTK